MASLLLALFVFIYAEKVLHTHDKTSFRTEQKSISQVSANASCTLCDFTIAKDGALPLANLNETKIELVSTQHYLAAVSFYTVPVDCRTSRGPPAVV